MAKLSSDLPSSVAGEDYEARLRSWTPQQRATQFRSVVLHHIRGLMEAATIVRVMEEQGDDLSILGLSAGLLSWLRRVAGQQVLPDVLFEFHGRLRERVAALPIIDQTKLLTNRTVELCTPSGECLMVDVCSLETRQITQVFARGRIRSLPEQRVYLEDKRLKTVQQEQPTPDGATRVHKRTGQVEIRRPCVLSRRELLALLSELD